MATNQVMRTREDVATILRVIRSRWRYTGQRGKWARFRMIWLMDKALGLHPSRAIAPLWRVTDARR